MAKSKNKNRFDITEYQEGMPCHRYILRNLKTENDALSFVKTFVNTMSHVGMKDSQIEACIYLFSTHLPPNSPLRGYAFEQWPNLLDGISLVDCIRMDSTVATYKRCMQFYKNQTSKTDVCKICPLYSKYCNNKKSIEVQILRYVLESKENYDYVKSMGVLPMHFRTVVDVLEHVTTALAPGIYAFYSDVYKALGEKYIADAHYSCDDKTLPCEEIGKYISNKISNGSVPVSYVSSPDFINRVIIILWDAVMECSLKTKEDIYALIFSLLSDDEERVSNTDIAEGADLGKSVIDEYYVKPVDEKKKTKKSTENVNYESINLAAIFSNLSQSEEQNSSTDFNTFSLFSAFTEVGDEESCVTKDVTDNTDNVDNSTREEPCEEDISTLKESAVAEVNTAAGCGNECVDAGTEEPDGDESPVEDASVTGNEMERSVDEDSLTASFHTTESGDIELKEISIPTYDKEFFEESGSMVSIPIVSSKELFHFAICLDHGESRLLTLFENHILKDKQMGMELIQTEKGIRYFLIYSPRLHAYFYTNMSDHRIYEILKSMLSHASIDKYCYYSFSLLAALMKFEIYPKSFFSLFCLSSVKMPGHVFSMEQILELFGARKAVGGITVKPDGEIESLPILYMHGYHNIYRRVVSGLKTEGCYTEYLERNQFDMIISRYYYQDLYEKENRILLAVKNANQYVFADPALKEYRKEGRCYTYRFVRCYDAINLVRSVLLAMDNKGYFKKYQIMISSISPISFTLFVATAEQERMKTLIHITILELLMQEKYKDVEYEVIEVIE